MQFGQRVQTELPVRAYACWQGMGGGEPIWYDDPAEIRALFNALAATNLAGKATTISTDDYTSFGFKFADDTGYGVMFDSMTVQIEENNVMEFYDLDITPELARFARQARQHTMGLAD